MDRGAAIMTNSAKKIYIGALLACGTLATWSLLYDGGSTHLVGNRTASKVLLRELANTNPKPETKPVTKLKDDKEKSLDEISATQGCYNSENCNFSKADPRAYEIEVSHKLTKQIKDFHKAYKNDPNAKQDLFKLARDNFNNENGFVQEAALDILRDFPNDPETLDTLSDGLKDNPNPLIAELVMPELKKFLGTSLEEQVHKTMDEMAKGAHFVAQTATENVLDFINPQSYDRYKRLLGQLNPGTKAYKNLNSALREYERRHIGG